MREPFTDAPNFGLCAKEHASSSFHLPRKGRKQADERYLKVRQRDLAMLRKAISLETYVRPWSLLSAIPCPVTPANARPGSSVNVTNVTPGAGESAGSPEARAHLLSRRISVPLR